MNRVHDDIEVPRLLHNLLRELGWTHGEITASLVHQALGQVRHLRKQADQLAAMTAARDEVYAIAKRTFDRLLMTREEAERLDELRKVGAP